jgi:beta-lactam-binding protein with PASTA domain
MPLAACYAYPPPDMDGWPVAVPDSLGSTPGVPMTFSGASLLSNDVGMSLTVTGVDAVGTNGGHITGTDPYTYVPAPLFVGTDTFGYQISDAMAETTEGVVRVAVTANTDSVAPSVSIDSPASGSVAGMVTISASASDNVGVAGVTFFDGAAQIGPEVGGASPFQAIWNSTLVAEGSHTLSAVARDAAGNTAPSAGVSVTVHNMATVPGVVGQTQAAAMAAISGAGLVGGTTNANSPSAVIGTVISQIPAGGNTVALGSSVALSISIGALVPGIVGSTQAAATSAITAAGLMVGTVTGTNSAAPAGSVISQDLVAGTSVAPGTSMSFVFSLGVANVSVPGVVNLTQSAATTAITGAGLMVGTVTTGNSSTVAAGSVISQNPVGGASAAPGSAVALLISSGPSAPVGGLVAAFGFEEATGTTAVNSANAAFNGTVFQAVRTAAGKIGKALSFDGVNDWVTVNDTTASPLDLSTGMTLEAWVNPTAAMSGWATILMKERGAAGAGLLSYALYANDGAPQASGFVGPAGYLRMNPAASTTDQGIRQASHPSLPLNTWTHLASTYDGANMRFYVNGVLVATKAQTGSIAAGNQALRIGGNASSGEFFRGLIDEVRIYNRALSATEITTDMNTPVVQ